MIKLVDVSLVYQNMVHSLKNVDLHVEKQEFVFLVGPTGGGKSSILRLVYRDIIPTKGSVFVFGKEITEMKNSEIPFLRRRIGVIFQDFLLLPNKNVFQNVAFALEVKATPQRAIKNAVSEVVEWMGLSSRAYDRVTQLSGGEQQRVCIARSLVNKPDILLADEPTGNLDPDTSYEIVELLERINSRGTTVICATHDEKIVDAFRKRVVSVVEGRVISDDRKGGYSYKKSANTA